MAPPPLVTGISPKEGPLGTKVIIRGEHLGVSRNDLIELKICGIDCTLSALWKSPKQIVARTGITKVKGDIIVTTKSGGVGSSLVQFRGYNIQMGPLQESPIWVDEVLSNNSTVNRISAPVADEDTNDPLGICDEHNDQKPSEEFLNKLVPEGCGNTSLPNFHPSWFLLENHSKTSFEDLKKGLNHLRYKSQQTGGGPFLFAKTNLSTFIQCLEYLNNINQKIKSDKIQNDNQPCTSKLENLLTKSNMAAEEVFNEIIKRKEKADITRNAMTTINRFKLLFFLPNNIDKNIKKGDYDLVITDYMRVKSLNWLRGVPVFERVFDEIEKKMDELRRVLHLKLLRLPSPIEHQRKFIGYLNHLNFASPNKSLSSLDPAWDCLSNQFNWIINLINRLRQEFIEKETKERMLSYKSKGYRNHHSNAAPARVQFIDELTKLIKTYLGSFISLKNDYLNGKFHSSDSTFEIEPQKKKTLQEMPEKIISVFSLFVNQPITSQSSNQTEETPNPWPMRTSSDEEGDNFNQWMVVCVRNLRSCICQMEDLELSSHCLELLESSDKFMKVNCINSVLKSTVGDAKNLWQKEGWSVEEQTNFGSITFLPTLFEGEVDQVLTTLQEVVTPNLFNYSDNKKERLLTRRLCMELFTALPLALTKLSNVKDNNKKQNKNKNSDLSQDKKLLIILNNNYYTSRQILPKLFQQFLSLHYPLSNGDFENVEKIYREVNCHVLKEYVECKSGLLIGHLEGDLRGGGFQWQKCSTVQGVSNYIKECMLGLIHVHSEISSTGSSFLKEVLMSLGELVAEELNRLTQCAEGFDHNGRLQARLDLEAWELISSSFKTQKSRNLIKEALKSIPDLNKDQYILKDRLVTNFKSNFSIHLSCLKSSFSP